MKDDWIRTCKMYLKEKGFYASSRKIIRPPEKVKFKEFKSDLKLSDIGYTSSKLSSLKRLYFHADSYNLAKQLWSERKIKGGYASVSFTCFNHLLKADPNKGSSRASIMGPCLQSIVITWCGRNNYEVDIFYRTTELFKKFPADLIFIRQLLTEIDPQLINHSINFHFANVTLHPMYFVTLLAQEEGIKPISLFENIKKWDERFHRYAVKWTASYLMDNHYSSIAKFSQAQRVKTHADKYIIGRKRDKIIDYLRSEGR